MSNILEDGLTECLTNKLLDMNKQIVVIDGSVNNNYIRVISFEEWAWDYEKDCPVLIDKVYKLQIKIYGFLTSKYHTIKEWSFNVNDAAEDELAKNEAVELLNNIINPYKHYGNI